MNDKTVLIVDDTPDNLSLISGLLKGECRVKVATGGEKALSIARSDSKPDLILLDVMMPDIDGYEVARQLKADPATAAIPIVFLTSNADAEDMKKGLALGAADYITKPVDPAALRKRVADILK